MDEPRSATCSFDWRPLLALALLAAGLRAWQIAHTEVPARDAIGFIRIAWQLEHGDDWRAVIRTAPQPPGYPLAVLAVSVPARRLLPGELPDVMQLCAQLTSALAGVVLVVPMYCLGRDLFGRRVGFWAALLFQCLPASGRVLADGLSEGVFLLCAATAFWLAVRAFDRRSPPAFAGVGFCGGLAYLTRPEGALIVAAAGVVLAAVQLRAATRRPWGNWLRSLACLAAAALLVGGPFVLVAGRLTTKLTANTILHQASIPEPKPQGVAAGPAVLAVWWTDESGTVQTRGTWAVRTLGEELLKSFVYVLWVPALVGLVRFRDRFRGAGVWVMLLVCAALGYLLYRVAFLMGYLSDRHTLLILLCGCFWAAAGMMAFGDGLAWLLRRVRPGLAGSRWAGGGVLAAVPLLLVSGAALARTLEPMHADRAGFRQAGYWLAKNALPGDDIDDPYCWSEYYAGGVFREGTEPQPRRRPPCSFVVVERSSNKHPRLPPRHDMRFVEEKGRVVQTWPVRRSREKAEIVVYQVPRL